MTFRLEQIIDTGKKDSAGLYTEKVTDKLSDIAFLNYKGGGIAEEQAVFFSIFANLVGLNSKEFQSSDNDPSNMSYAEDYKAAVTAFEKWRTTEADWRLKDELVIVERPDKSKAKLLLPELATGVRSFLREAKSQSTDFKNRDFQLAFASFLQGDYLYELQKSKPASYAIAAIESSNSFEQAFSVASLQYAMKLSFVVEGNATLMKQMELARNSFDVTTRIIENLNEWERLFSKQGKSISFNNPVVSVTSDSNAKDFDLDYEQARISSELTNDDLAALEQLHSKLKLLRTELNEGSKGERYGEVDMDGFVETIDKVLESYEGYQASASLGFSQSWQAGTLWQGDKKVPGYIRNAIISAQTSSDNVKDRLKQGTFQFEQFYNTASTLMDTIEKVLAAYLKRIKLS